MEDQYTWEQALKATREMYRSLHPVRRRQLDELIEEIMGLKHEMLELTLSSGSSAVCSSCGGTCCLHGKYHVTVLDVLAYLVAGTELIAPEFGNGPHCPYSDTAGCRMEPRLRPMTCVVFNCDLVEERLTASNRETLQVCEQQLRDAISRAVPINAISLNRPLLLAFKQNTATHIT